jgi:L-lactate utilization protein LutB
VLRATPERVYRAFLDADAMAKWLPPNGFTGKVHQLDAKVGGTYKMSFTNFSTGKSHSFGGKYLELKPHERIRYTDKFDDANLPGEMQTTIALKQVFCGTEMHIVLVDNGRSDRLGMPDFWYSLKCIRCGACMNTCPVYRRSGGLSYGATYSGPIGVIIDPAFDIRKYGSLPFASTLNGSCTSVCPVKINIHEQIYKWRQVIAERRQLPFVKQEAMRAAGKVLLSPKLYRAAVETAGTGVEHLPRFMMYSRLNAWGRQREVPAAPPHTFRQWYLKNRKPPRSGKD